MAFVHDFHVDFGYPIEAIFPTINCNRQSTTRRYGIQFVVTVDLHTTSIYIVELTYLEMRF